MITPVNFSVDVLLQPSSGNVCRMVIQFMIESAGIFNAQLHDQASVVDGIILGIQVLAVGPVRILATQSPAQLSAVLVVIPFSPSRERR
jgi:hypothetical protein